MRTAFPFLLGALLICGAAFAAADKTVTSPDGSTVYVIPAGSPVNGKITYGTGEDITARFDGKFVLSGTFHSGADGYVFLKPDRDIAARLPRWKESGAPVEFGFENSDAAVKALMPAAAHGNRTSDGNQHVVIDVDRYSISIECDTASYTVRFLSVHSPGRVAGNVTTPEGC